MAKSLVFVAVCLMSLLCHLVVVDGAAGDVGEACLAGNTCNSEDAVCESSTCKKKVGITCSAGECVANGACATTCTCSANFVAKSDNTACLKVVDQSCSADIECLENGQCGDGGSGNCKCSANYVAKADKMKCLKVVDQACTANDQCLDNGQCGDGGTGTCKCSANYVAKTDKTQCLAKIGQTCTDAMDCVTSADECTTATPTVCACTGTNVATDDNSDCKKKAGETCTAAAECASNADCPAGTTRTCTCKSGFTKQTSGKCLAKIGQTCTDIGDCVTSADNCTTVAPMPKVCACTGTNVATDDNSDCKKKAGEVCTAAADCASNAECPAGNGTCTCKSGFTKQTSGKCSGAASITASLLVMLAVFVTSRLV